MKCSLSNLVMFATGAAIGSLVTWKIIKTKYEKITQEEIESVKEVFSRRSVTSEPDEKEPEIVMPRPAELSNVVTSLGYTNYSDIVNTETEEEDRPVDRNRPYVIAPEECGELDGYEIMSLTYYADGVLTDISDEPIGNVDLIVGSDSLTHFGEYEDDSVFVRNEKTKTDYEILKDTRNYSDVMKRDSYRSEE